MTGQWATIIGASITGAVTLLAALLAYVFGRWQKGFEVRYTQFYERRAEVVGELYSLIFAISERFREWLSLEEENDGTEVAENRLAEQSSAIEQELDKFRRYYTKHDIWISVGTRDMLVELQRQFDEGWLSLELPKRGDSAREQATDWVENRFPTVREDLKLEFYRILGVENIQEQTDKEPILQGLARAAVGVASTTIIGVGVGIVLSLLLDNWTAGMIAGLAIGLGFGLLLEYINPSKQSSRE